MIYVLYRQYTRTKWFSFVEKMIIDCLCLLAKNLYPSWAKGSNTLLDYWILSLPLRKKFASGNSNSEITVTYNAAFDTGSWRNPYRLTQAHAQRPRLCRYEWDDGFRFCLSEMMNDDLDAMTNWMTSRSCKAMDIILGLSLSAVKV